MPWEDSAVTLLMAGLRLQLFSEDPVWAFPLSVLAENDKGKDFEQVLQTGLSDTKTEPPMATGEAAEQIKDCCLS